MSDEPLPTEVNGRDHKGRFGPGNKFGRGNPLNRKVAKLRSALLRRVSTDDIREVVDKLLELAKGGDLAAIRELLDRTLGKPVAMDMQPADPIDPIDAEIEAIALQLAARHESADESDADD